MDLSNSNLISEQSRVSAYCVFLLRTFDSNRLKQIQSIDFLQINKTNDLILNLTPENVTLLNHENHINFKADQKDQAVTRLKFLGRSRNI